MNRQEAQNLISNLQNFAQNINKIVTDEINKDVVQELLNKSEEELAELSGLKKSGEANVIDDIDQEIAEIRYISKILAEKIKQAINSPMPMFNPVSEYAQLKKVVKELLELKAKILISKAEKPKELAKEIRELIQKYNYDSEK